MAFQVCPLHSLDEIEGEWISDEIGWQFTCRRQDHVRWQGPYTWFTAPSSPEVGEMSGIAADLGLSQHIPEVLASYEGTWIEYGVLERAYAVSHPDDWTFLVERYGHTAIGAKRYTASAFLGGALGHLERGGYVAVHSGPATGRWTYNRLTGWWALPPGPGWESRLSWKDSGLTVEYVHGQTEIVL